MYTTCIFIIISNLYDVILNSYDSYNMIDTFKDIYLILYIFLYCKIDRLYRNENYF